MIDEKDYLTPIPSPGGEGWPRGRGEVVKGKGVRSISSSCSLFAVKIDHPMDDSLFESLSQMVSEERRQRVKRFLRREDACRCVAGEALARFCIGRREKIPFHEISFANNEHGKPFVNGQATTQFNISHSGSWAICAVDGLPVGVDVERIHTIDFAISKRFFSQEEHEELASLSGEARKERFFDYWTLKESYIKAIGKGLFCPLNSFTILIQGDCIEMKTENKSPPMFFKQYNLGQDYKCALCASHEDLPNEIAFVNAKELATPFL